MGARRPSRGPDPLPAQPRGRLPTGARPTRTAVRWTDAICPKSCSSTAAVGRRPARHLTSSPRNNMPAPSGSGFGAKSPIAPSSGTPWRRARCYGPSTPNRDMDIMWTCSSAPALRPRRDGVLGHQGERPFRAPGDRGARPRGAGAMRHASRAPGAPKRRRRLSHDAPLRTGPRAGGCKVVRERVERPNGNVVFRTRRVCG